MSNNPSPQNKRISRLDNYRQGVALGQRRPGPRGPPADAGIPPEGQAKPNGPLAPEQKLADPPKPPQPALKPFFKPEENAEIDEIWKRLNQKGGGAAPLRGGSPAIFGPGMGGGIASEFSQPTIEDQIHGELAPPREDTPPEQTPTVEPTLSAWQQFVSGPAENLRGWYRGMALHSMPRTTLKDPRLGELGLRWASSNIAARPVAEVFSADVLGNSQINPVEFGAALTEDNLRSVKQAFLDAADEAENRKELIDDLREQIADIKGMGDEEDPEIRQQMDAMRREIRRLSKLTDEDVARFRAKAQAREVLYRRGQLPVQERGRLPKLSQKARSSGGREPPH